MDSATKNQSRKSERRHFTTSTCSWANPLNHILVLAGIQVAFLLAPGRAFAFGPGDRLEATSAANIRTGPDTTYKAVDTANAGDYGVIISGPYYSSSYVWYSNHWDLHLPGYSATINLQAIPPLAPNLIAPGNSTSPGPVVIDQTPQLTWYPATGATGYGLYVKDQTTETFVVDNDAIGNVTSFTPALTPGHNYSWNMRSSDSAGFSGFSTTLFFQYIPAVTGITTYAAGSVTATSAVFKSSFYPNGTSANAYFQYGTTTAYGTPYGEAAITTYLNSQWLFWITNNTLSPNTTYHYQVVVINNGGTYYGNDSSFTTLSPPPSAPSNLSVTNVSNGISLSWQDNSSNESGFLIRRRQGANTTYFSAGANQTSYTDTSVTSGIQYCYAVAATNSSGSSSLTPEQCDTYIPPGPAPVAIIVGNLTPAIGTTTYYGTYSTGSGLSYSWTTSTGQKSSAMNPQLAFNSPGSYWISLTITDSLNRTSTASISVNVQPSNAGTSIGVALGADPVVLSTGNYVQNHVDLHMPGIGFPFEFRRFYNSKFSDQTGRPLGFGWTFNYNERIQDTGTNVLLIRGDGSTWAFYPTNNGYIGEPGNFDSLIHNTNTDNTWTLTDKGQTVTLFGTNGILESITDKNGNSLTCSYVAGVLNQIEDTAGRIISFTTNSYGCIASMSDLLGRTVQYQYDSNTNLMAVVDMNGNTNFYNYNANHQMTSAIDGRGVCYIQNVYDPTNFTVIRQADAYTNWTYLGYDFANRITYVTNALNKVSIHRFDENLLETNVVDEANNQETFGYDANRDRTYIKDKNGNITQYDYDSLGNVTNKIDALNNVTTIQYDALNNPIRRVDALTNLTTFGYDEHGNLTSTTNALNLVSKTQYYPNGLPYIQTDARGFGTTNYYDSQGNLTNVIDAAGAPTSFQYDDAGRRTGQLDALNHPTSFGYDNDDNLTNTVNTLGYTNSFTYDTDNNRTSFTDPRGATITNVFDLKDRLIAVIAPLNHTNGTIYDALDRKIATSDALGHQTGYAYDDIGNLIAVTNALNQVTQYTYDPNGNQTSVIDPTQHYVTNFFDALNRKVATIDISISTNYTTYDALGHVTATTNANNQVTHFFYDAIGRLTNVVDSANQSVYFDYDNDGNRIHTTDPNAHRWTNVFDAVNRLAEQDDPDGHQTIFHYDAVGNLTNKITANHDAIVYDYDPLNRLKAITYPSGPPVTFAYDEAGNRTNMVDGLGTTSWQYDLLNRMTSVTDPFGETVTNGFDANGNRLILAYPGNKTVNYGFDALNRMTSLTNWLNGVVSYGYDTRGNLVAGTNANGTTVVYGYDAADRLVTLTNFAPDASVIAAYALTLDGVGNHRQETHEQPLFPILSNQTNSYGYDSDNRLTDLDGAIVTNNPNGDLVGIGTNANFIYDFDDRLLQFTTTNVSGTCNYDGLGNRLGRTVNWQARRFVLDRMGALTQVLLENDTNNAPVAYYVYGLGLAQTISAGGTVATYQFDIQGSTVALTDSSGRLADSYAYDSFGDLANSDEMFPQPFHYLGRYGVVDDANGLLYARARYFCPKLGRFLSKDTFIGNDRDSQSLNRYIYALNSPLSKVDFTGHFSWDTYSASVSQLGESVAYFGLGIAEAVATGVAFPVEKNPVALGSGVLSSIETLNNSFKSIAASGYNIASAFKNQPPISIAQAPGPYDSLFAIPQVSKILEVNDIYSIFNGLPNAPNRIDDAFKALTTYRALLSTETKALAGLQTAENLQSIIQSDSMVTQWITSLNTQIQKANSQNVPLLPEILEGQHISIIITKK
jgi:RHS repeat-associated protein